MPSSSVADLSSILTCSIAVLGAMYPQDTHLMELGSIVGVPEVAEPQKPTAPIKFMGTRLRCMELEEKLAALIAKLTSVTYPFKDDVFDAMSSLRQHDQMLCELEEYISADLPAKEEFLYGNCANMRATIRETMQYLQVQLQTTFDAKGQADYLMRPLRRKVHHARKLLTVLRKKVFLHNDSTDVGVQLHTIEALLLDAEETDLQFDCHAFHYGRDLLIEEKDRIIAEWKLVRRDIRQVRRATKEGPASSSSPSSSSSLLEFRAASPCQY
ncbi:hypothetical protein SDRG_10932 [Saprolegnia diclina VS20]|uniref:Uncharacterized protein n=1 Tax=Saprolegnia diclina (strain VS20) TaxID=1156394 RepID=T0QCQ1_SAPDV|nr:hypothetical protein SDRG_10932 [Saprolegnia diclina VS20]EQC31330.1 hypothetical protein SDRG_10932 [Saprolegnia diclina VS20]|eukprot:XP_008615171.1 hypothetical protein SDRG_10932 [Saprolegnia diclina VS20]